MRGSHGHGLLYVQVLLEQGTQGKIGYGRTRGRGTGRSREGREGKRGFHWYFHVSSWYSLTPDIHRSIVPVETLGSTTTSRRDTTGDRVTGNRGEYMVVDMDIAYSPATG